MKIRNIAASLGGVAVIAASIFAAAPTVAATYTETPVCVPSDGVAAYDETIVDSEAYDETIVDEAAHFQRYSWTGGPHESDSAPAFPSDDWQANVAGDPHGIGVAGAYFKSHGNSGNGDWFYLEWVPEESHVVHHDEVSHVVHHDAVPPVTCEEDPETVYDIGLYCYTKVNPALPASWENSGYQTLVAVKQDSTTDWTLEEKRDLCDAPEESCEPGAPASQSDWVMHEGDFTFPEHITFPVDNIGWPPIYNAVHTDLTQVQSDDCETEVLPQECVSAGAWGTEADDTAPVQTADGLLFTGGSGSAVGYGTAITGNLQGLPDITVSVTGDVDVFYPRIVINSLADGGYAYDSLTVVSEGTVTGSSIAASNKRGFEQHTLDEWAALLPGNQLVAFFLHLDSGATADQSALVTGVDGECFTLDTVPEYPGDLVEEGEWVDGDYDCDDTTVGQTRTVTTKEYEFVDGNWVLEAESNWDVAIEQGEPRALTEKEIADKDASEDCKVVIPPTSNVPLAYTPGGEHALEALMIAGGLFAAAMIAFVAAAVRRRQA